MPDQIAWIVGREPVIGPQAVCVFLHGA
jgi:hypothetical protein